MIRALFPVAALLLAVPCRAAEPTEELLKLVPPDAGLCLIVRDVSGHADRLTASPFLEHLRASPLGKVLLDGAIQKYQELDKQLHSYLQADLRDLREQIFADGFVFAFWPAQDAGEERGLFLLRARKPELLDGLFKRLNELETKSGNVTALESRQYNGVPYWRRADKRGETNFLFLQSGLLAVTHDETLLKQVIDRRANAPASSAIWQQVSDLGVTDALAVFWLNPRAFDSAILAKTKTDPSIDVALQQAVLQYWRQIHTVALAVRLDSALELSLHVRGKLPVTKWPDGVALNGLWTRLPERAIFAIAGQVDFSGLAALIEAATPAEAKQKMHSSVATASQAFLGRDFVKDVLPNLGPNCGFCLAAPPNEQKGWFPDVVFALQVRSEPGDRPLGQALFDALRAVAGLAVLAHNSEGYNTQLHPEQQDKVAVLSLRNPKVFPPGCEPAFAFKSGYLLLAGSPATIRRFDAPDRKAAEPKVDPEITFLARFSFAEAVAYLRNPERRASLVAALALAHQQPAANVDQQLGQLVSVLELLHNANLSVHSAPDHVVMKLQLSFTHPLRK